jgi:hypothetical protein
MYDNLGSHQNLMGILDFNMDEKWSVSSTFTTAEILEPAAIFAIDDGFNFAV